MGQPIVPPKRSDYWAYVKYVGIQVVAAATLVGIACYVAWNFPAQKIWMQLGF